MKDKLLKVGLAIALVGIWGTIIHRIINGNTNDVGIIVSPKLAIISNSNEVEYFKLLTNYKDPFLSNYLATETTTNIIDSSLLYFPKQVDDKPKKYVRFPLVEYQGMSKNKSRYQSVALVKIDRKTQLLEVGGKVGQITITEIYRDSIKIEKEGVFKTIKKGIK